MPFVIRAKTVSRIRLKNIALKLIKSDQSENCIYPWGWGQEGAFEGTVNVLYLDLGGAGVNIFICRN